MEVWQDAVVNKVHCLYRDRVCLFQQDKVSSNSAHITATEFRCQDPSAIWCIMKQRDPKRQCTVEQIKLCIKHGKGFAFKSTAIGLLTITVSLT